MDSFLPELLSVFVGMVIAWTIKPAYEGYFRRKGEIFAELASAKALEEARALGRQTLEQENETHKAQLNAKNLMRTAALDKRLEIHQQAFVLWWELRELVHGDPQPLGDHILKCQSWWVEHCLFLDPKAREDFSLAYSSASLHRSYVNPPVRDEDASMALQENWARIMAPGRSLPAAVALPSIAEDRRDPSEPIASNVDLTAKVEGGQKP
ncbi:hypothetical protein [Achromobacter xylosoxidans]|uniref:hypothetical protein n=1 Tax=Alcaligenes xylosoxydans xylosoxydans TaxID=85698 RepID=UPI003D05340A